MEKKASGVYDDSKSRILQQVSIPQINVLNNNHVYLDSTIRTKK
jgi:hypothetical protein